MTDEEIVRFKIWRESGLSPGQGSQQVSYVPPIDGWELGPPDLILEMPEDYTLPADGLDIYRNFVMPLPLTERKFVRALEFQPNGRLAIHHAQIVIDKTSWSRERDDEDEGQGFTGMEFGNNENPSGNFVGWTPGQLPFECIQGAPFVLDPTTDLVVRLHLTPTGRPEKIRPRIGLYFTEDPPTRITDVIHISSQEIDIPAGKSDYVIKESFVLPVSVEVLGVYPHAHYIGKDLRIYAKLPNGNEQAILRIPDWDFFWQQTYQYENPLELPAGTEIFMHYRYDNSAANIRNPFSPAQRIQLGWNSTDEMAEIELSILLSSREDQRALKRVQNEFTRRQLGDANYFFTIGMEYMTAQKTEQAASYFTKALTVDPSFQQATNNLGVIEEQRGNFSAAQALFETARKQDPDDRNALINLVHLIKNNSDGTAAENVLIEFLHRKPEDEKTRNMLIDTMLANGKDAEGLELARQGLALNPLSAGLNFRIGVIYAETQNFALAQRHLLVASQPNGDSTAERSLQADALYALALHSLQQEKSVDFDRYLTDSVNRKSDHRNARLLATTIALHRKDLTEAKQHLNVLLRFPANEKIGEAQWLTDLPFPQGAILVANLMQNHGDHESAQSLLDFALKQARLSGNQSWMSTLERALSTFRN